jgi:pyridoxal phosphate enzyme (YggS family)
VPTASSPPSPTARRLAEVRARIDAALERSGRPAGSVELVAVAKTATPETLREAWEAGQRLFGHNRVQALEAHREVLPEATWHLLGPIQGKKVRRALAAADLLEAVGDPTVVERLARRLEEDGATEACPLLVQVNLAPEDGRYGVPLEELEDFLRRLAAQPLLRTAGLMTIAPLGADEATTRALFRRLAASFEELRRGGLLPLEAQLSMGMSGDYETAVEEGATLVRVGRAIFPAADVHEA